MIVSHKYKFVIAVPVGLGCGPWLNRIAEEGPEGYLEILGHPNSMCVPEGCGEYARFFVDAPQHRLPRMWLDRVGKPWDMTPEDVDFTRQKYPHDSSKPLHVWMEWYCLIKRREFRLQSEEDGSNGWGMRSEDGPWMFFEHPSILARTFAGIGNVETRENALWGCAMTRILKLEEATRGWKEVAKMMFGDSVLARDARALIQWHIPKMQHFYELPDHLAALFAREGAWNCRLDFENKF